ncbi:MAG: HypC/HybG/HupF family hydrogenase formation chaperone [Candidatus Brocadiaceae bacterium]|nr:HypC/HybG/HupF family hydrogenase formation chaperone [Candidatus Brocadiaceae bacterium]
MCWAVPTRIVQVDGEVGTVDISGAAREVSLCLIEDPQPGDYVLIHAGFAIQKVDEQEAQETLRLLDELRRSLGEGDAIRR